MEFLYEYGLFLAKAITFIVSVGIILALVIGASQKNNREPEGIIDVTKINERYDDIKDRIKSVVYSDEVLKQEVKAAKKKQSLSFHTPDSDGASSSGHAHRVSACETINLFKL